MMNVGVMIAPSSRVNANTLENILTNNNTKNFLISYYISFNARSIIPRSFALGVNLI